MYHSNWVAELLVDNPLAFAAVEDERKHGQDNHQAAHHTADERNHGVRPGRQRQTKHEEDRNGVVGGEADTTRRMFGIGSAAKLKSTQVSGKFRECHRHVKLLGVARFADLDRKVSREVQAHPPQVVTRMKGRDNYAPSTIFLFSDDTLLAIRIRPR